MTASDLTKSALRELCYRGFECWRNNNVRAVAGRTFTGKRGVSDIIGFHRSTGIFLVAEIKAGKDKLSMSQIEFLTDVSKAGGFAVVVTEHKNQVTVIEINDYLQHDIFTKIEKR